MFTKTDICNLSLGHLGISKRISDIDENSLEASTLKTFYPVALGQSLGEADFPFVKVKKALNLVGINADVEFKFSYLYPTDCMNFIRILPGSLLGAGTLNIPYQINQVDTATVINTNVEGAFAEWISDTLAPQLYPHDFALAVSYILGSFCATTLTAGDSANLGDALLKKYSIFISKAAARSKNETNPVQPPTTPSIAARG